MQTLTQTPINRAILAFEEQHGVKFAPDDRFYKKVGINQKRFGMLTRGELKIFAFESQNLADYFKVPVTDLI